MKIIKFPIVIITLIILLTSALIVPVNATLGTNEFYYSGTTKGSYTVVQQKDASWLVDILAEIADYLLGIMTMGFRIVVVGWTTLFENLLATAIQSTTNSDTEDLVDSTSASTNPRKIVTIESIVYNKVPIFDINIFNFEVDENATATGT